MDAARRAFLRGQFLTAEGRVQYQRGCARLGPEPPWLAGRLTPDICGPCEQPCAAACETRIIRYHPVGHPLAGVAYLAFETGRCTWCGACADACPIGVTRDFPQPRLGCVTVDLERCLASSGVVCVSCLTHCEYNSIARDARGRVEVDAAACPGCGACIAVCPEQALTLRATVDPGSQAQLSS